jgi:hypothetical protein
MKNKIDLLRAVSSFFGGIVFIPLGFILFIFIAEASGTLSDAGLFVTVLGLLIGILFAILLYISKVSKILLYPLATFGLILAALYIYILLTSNVISGLKW